MSYGTLIDPQLPVTPQVDASAAGVGGAFHQDNQPVAFYFSQPQNKDTLLLRKNVLQYA